jgi:hypothetical protein
MSSSALLTALRDIGARAPGVALRLLLEVSGVTERRRAREQALEAQLVLRRGEARPAGTDFSMLKGSTIFPSAVTDATGIPVGTLKIWYDADTRIAKREFTALHAGLVSALGNRRLPLEPKQLPSAADSLATLREVTLREVESILQRKLRKGTGAPPVSSPAADTQARPAAAPAVPAGRPHAAVSGAVRSKAAHIHQTDEGYLEGAGLADRTLQDREDPERGVQTIQQFYVDIVLTTGDNPGRVKRIWGADLERAIAAVEAFKGDHVRVKHLGRERAHGGAGDKRGVYKNVYEIEILGGRK